MYVIQVEQMRESFIYQGELIDIDNIKDIQDHFSEVNEVYIEELYEEKQILLKSLLEKIPFNNLQQLWKINRINSTSDQYLALISDDSHLCTCMSIVNKGIICRHFWYVFRYSKFAKFDVKLIPSRWYKDEMLNQLDNVQTGTIPDEENLLIPEKFHVLNNLRGNNIFTEQIHKNVTKRAIYAKGWGMSRKALDYAIDSGKYDEFIGLLHNFIDYNTDFDNNIDIEKPLNPVITRPKGRQPNKRSKVLSENTRVINRNVTLNNISTVSVSTPEIFGNMNEIVENNVSNDMVEEENIDTNEQTSSIDKIIDNNNQNNAMQKKRCCSKCGNSGHYARTCKGKHRKINPL
jgi:hypothetical protein